MKKIKLSIILSAFLITLNAQNVLQIGDQNIPLEEFKSVFYKNKISTAIFFAEHILPRNIGYLRAIKYGSKSIMAINAKDF